MIYKYDFTADSEIMVFGYLFKFLKLLVRDENNPRTLNFFSRVVKDQSDPEKWTIKCYLAGHDSDSDVPAYDYRFFVHQTSGIVMQMVSVFNGTDMGEWNYTMLTDEDPPIDWNEDYAKYYTYDMETDTYIPRSSSSDEYVPNMYYYRSSFEDWLTTTPVAIGGLYTAGFRYGYLTSKGVIIMDHTGQLSIAIVKTNNDRIGVVFTGYDASLAAGYDVAADGDTIRPSFPALSFIGGYLHPPVARPPIDHQTTMTPIVTHRTDISSYLDGLYVMSQSQLRSDGILEVGGVRYATNGYFALRE